MRKLIAIITFACFLSAATAEGRVLAVCVQIGCSLELITLPKSPQRASGCCSSMDYGCEVYRCVPFSRSIVTLKDVIEYKHANSITTRCDGELSNPVLNAVLGDPHGQLAGRPAGNVSENPVTYGDKSSYQPLFENLLFIHPQIAITVLRL